MQATFLFVLITLLYLISKKVTIGIVKAMKKVLVLSPFFYPEPISTGKYNTSLVDELVKQGYEVDVWCSHPIYPSWSVSESNSQLDGVHIVRGGRLNKYPSNPLLRRAILELWFFLFLLKMFIFTSKKYDVVVPIFPPSFFALLLPLFKSKYSKIFGIVHDLQGVYADREAGAIKKTIFSLISFVEKRAFKVCDHLVYLSDGMRTTANELYRICPDKTSVSYPFVTIDEFVDCRNLSGLINDGEKSLVYSGALGEKQNGQGLIELFNSVLASDLTTVAHVFSMGPIFEVLKSEFQSSRLKFHDLVDEKDLPELLLRSKVQVVPQIQGSSNGSLPSKLPNLLASGTGVFCITDEGSELIDILKEYPQGVSVTDWDVTVNTDLLVAMLNDVADKTVNQDLLSKFTRSGLVSKISKELTV